MKYRLLLVLILFTHITSVFGQTKEGFPGKTLYWSNLKKPNYLDSLQILGLIKYKYVDIVRKKEFIRTVKSADSTYELKSEGDFYEYKIRWTKKGRKRIVERSKGIYYQYLGYAQFIMVNRNYLKD